IVREPEGSSSGCPSWPALSSAHLFSPLSFLLSSAHHLARRQRTGRRRSRPSLVPRRRRAAKRCDRDVNTLETSKIEFVDSVKGNPELSTALRLRTPCRSSPGAA